MKLLIDNNIIIDYLRRRTPFNNSAELLFLLARAHEFDLWLSPTQIGDTFYVLSKGGKSCGRVAKEELKFVREFMHVCSFSESDVDECLESDWEDLEDALVYQAARAIKADAIITRNQQDFARSRIPVFDCDEFFAWLRETKGVDYSYINL